VSSSFRLLVVICLHAKIRSLKHIVFQMKRFFATDIYALHQLGIYPNPAKNIEKSREFYFCNCISQKAIEMVVGDL